MKTYKTPATSKLVARFDNELKNLLMADLKAFKERNQFLANNNNNQVAVKAAWSIYTSTYQILLQSPTKSKSRSFIGTGFYFFDA